MNKREKLLGTEISEEKMQIRSSDDYAVGSNILFDRTKSRVTETSRIGSDVCEIVL